MHNGNSVKNKRLSEQEQLKDAEALTARDSLTSQTEFDTNAYSNNVTPEQRAQNARSRWPEA